MTSPKVSLSKMIFVCLKVFPPAVCQCYWQLSSCFKWSVAVIRPASCSETKGKKNNVMYAFWSLLPVGRTEIEAIYLGIKERNKMGRKTVKKKKKKRNSISASWSYDGIVVISMVIQCHPSLARQQRLYNYLYFCFIATSQVATFP